MPHDRVKTAILGGSGYTGLELARILLGHPRAELTAVSSREAQPLAKLHPSLYGRTEIVAAPHTPSDLAEMGVGVAFCALPHGASREVVGPLLAHNIRVIDLSADYRLKDAATYREWYGDEHGDPDNLAHAVYGLPELAAPGALAAARLVANPGCYPQTAILGLHPLLAEGLVEPAGIIVNSSSGISGAGRTPKLGTLYPECNENMVAYNVGVHRHTPEMEQALGLSDGAILFAPHLAPMDRGIHSTIYATPTRAVTQAGLLELFRARYADCPFVRVRDDYPSTKDCSRTNYCDLTVRVVRGKVVVLATLDNLVRGASGVAVQNLNWMCGFAEAAGLGA